MKQTWTLAVALSVLGAAGWADDEKAHVREGHEGAAHADHATAAADRHPSPEHESASAPSAPAGSSAPEFSSDPVRDAGLRHPRPGTGTGDRDGRFGRGGGRIYGGRGYYLYDPFFNGYYGYYPYYGYGGYYGGYGYGYGYGYGNGYGYRPYSRYYSDTGSLRILVDPNKTRVYVDGYYAGIADDFDGIFQRLHVAPGRHEITLRLEGYRTQKFRVYVPYDHTIKIHHQMVRGEGEDAAEEVLGPPEGSVAESGRYDRDRDPRRDERMGEDTGQLRLDVRPPDASIYIDGEFRGTARDHERLTLPPGIHRIEVVRPGYRTVEREVEIRPGRTADVQVELVR
jgi:hypothetical protein